VATRPAEIQRDELEDGVEVCSIQTRFSRPTEDDRDHGGLLLIPRSKVRVLHGPCASAWPSRFRLDTSVRRDGKDSHARFVLPPVLPRREGTGPGQPPRREPPIGTIPAWNRSSAYAFIYATYVRSTISRTSTHRRPSFPVTSSLPRRTSTASRTSSSRDGRDRPCPRTTRRARGRGALTAGTGVRDEP
jgi:hypothetical protein